MLIFLFKIGIFSLLFGYFLVVKCLNLKEKPWAESFTLQGICVERVH